MKIELNIDENKIIDSKYLSEVLADKIYDSQMDLGFNEFKKELLDSLKSATKQIVDEYVKEYWGKEHIEREVQDILEDMTKEEILKAMLKK